MTDAVFVIRGSDKIVGACEPAFFWVYGVGELVEGNKALNGVVCKVALFRIGSTNHFVLADWIFDGSLVADVSAAGESPHEV